MSINRNILIIDDSKVSRMMTTAILEKKYPEVQIHEAESADEAITISENNQIDYYSVDLNMPGMNGLELISKLKSNYPNAKFVLLTANIQEAIKNKANILGAHCVYKPISEDCIDDMMEHFNV